LNVQISTSVESFSGNLAGAFFSKPKSSFKRLFLTTNFFIWDLHTPVKMKQNKKINPDCLLQSAIQCVNSVRCKIVLVQNTKTKVWFKYEVSYKSHFVANHNGWFARFVSKMCQIGLLDFFWLEHRAYWDK
jgi:hypothetical protein